MGEIKMLYNDDVNSIITDITVVLNIIPLPFYCVK